MHCIRKAPTGMRVWDQICSVASDMCISGCTRLRHTVSLSFAACMPINAAKAPPELQQTDCVYAMSDMSLSGNTPVSPQKGGSPHRRM